MHKTAAIAPRDPGCVKIAYRVPSWSLRREKSRTNQWDSRFATPEYVFDLTGFTIFDCKRLLRSRLRRTQVSVKSFKQFDIKSWHQICINLCIVHSAGRRGQIVRHETMSDEIKKEVVGKTRRSIVTTAAQVAITAPAVGLLLSASTLPRRTTTLDARSRSLRGRVP